LLPDRAHGHRAVGFDHAAKIALDELAGKMQRLGIGGLDMPLRHRGLMDADKSRHAHEQAEDHDR
jgi:hypothetical protein